MAEARKLEQVRAVLNLAKLSESDLKTESYVLQFIPQIADSKQVKLLEVSKDILEYINNGESLFIKGGDLPTSVICSNSTTYELKEAETSNSLLIMPSLNQSILLEESENRTLKSHSVHGVYHTYYEMKPMKPKLLELKRVLEKHLYCGKDNESSGQGLSFTQLKEMIQASEAEILDKLSELYTIKIKNKWRLMDVGFLYAWITNLDSILRGKQLTIEQVTIEELMEWTKTYEEEIVDSECISRFVSQGDDCLKWDDVKVSQIFALYLLSELKAFDRNDFFAAWQESMPVGVTVCEEYLSGIALVDNDSTPSLVKYFPEFQLPADINRRLDTLFLTRAKWTLQDITPYIQPLTDDTLNVNALLTKYARSSMVNGVKHYSSKY